MHVAGDNPTSDELIDRVNDFLAQEEGVDFDGNWMLVVHWDDIPPFGFGNGFQVNHTCSLGSQLFLAQLFLSWSGGMIFYVPQQSK